MTDPYDPHDHEDRMWREDWIMFWGQLASVIIVGFLAHLVLNLVM